MKKKNKKEVHTDKINELEAAVFYEYFEIYRKTRISLEDFVNVCDVMGLASILAKRFHHGAGVSINRSLRSVNKYFLGKKENDLLNMGVDLSTVKIALSDVLIALDGAGAIVDGKITNVGCMILVSKRSCEKALRRLNENPDHDTCGKDTTQITMGGAHTRHGSMTAYSMKCPHSVNFVVSHKGRACILVKGKVIGQITRIEGIDGPVYIEPYFGVGFPGKGETHLVETSSPQIRTIAEKGFKSGDIFIEQLIKAKADIAWNKKRGMVHYVNKFSWDRQRKISDYPIFKESDKSKWREVLRKLQQTNQERINSKGSDLKHEIRSSPELRLRKIVTKDLSGTTQTHLDRFFKLIARFRHL
ncbi:MAG: hypothetical protein QF682_11150 [Candidatus Thermoplasmatota archaeon]|jgi:hypothetical protein|nr:hypothetical protein [Candidatus Thermoplasmatota archaeon]